VGHLLDRRDQSGRRRIQQKTERRTKLTGGLAHEAKILSSQKVCGASLPYLLCCLFMGVYQLGSSSSIILSAIEYINELLSDRSSLLARLERARSALPLDHPALSLSCQGEPLWERQWKGGEGRIDDEAVEDEDENNDDGDSS